MNSKSLFGRALVARSFSLLTALVVSACISTHGSGKLRIIGPSTIVERDGYVSFPVVADPPSRYPLTAQVRVFGTVVAGTDYTLFSTLVSAQPGSSDAILIRLHQDSVREQQKELIIELYALGDAAGDYTLPEPFRVQLVDDDTIGMPVAEVSAWFAFKENVSSNNVEVRLTKTSTETLALKWRLNSHTAVAGADFVAASGTLEFAPGETNAHLAIELNNDSTSELIEEFHLELFEPTPGLHIASPTNGISVIDDDRGYRFIDLQSTTTEGQTNHFVGIDRIGSFPFPTTVEVRVEPITAVPGIDYPDITYNVEFPAGDVVVSRYLELRLLNDELEDGVRDFRVILTNPSHNIPLVSGEDRMVVTMYDNELGYELDSDPIMIREPDGNLFEGPGAYVVLYRHGDYEAPSEVTVTFREASGSDLYNPPATAGVDFTPGTIKVRFERGARSAHVPLPIIDDALQERIELIGISFPRFIKGGDPVTDANIRILDNELNPLHTQALRPLGLMAWSFAPAGADKALANLLTSPSLNPTSTIVRLTARGELDPTFQPISYEGALQFLCGPNGVTFIIDRTNQASHLPLRFRRLKPDGTVDPAFSAYTANPEHGMAAGPGGELFLGLVGQPSHFVRIVKLGANGLVDPTFAPNQIQQEQGPTRFFAPTADGGLYAASPFRFLVNGRSTFLAKFNADGTVDPSVDSQHLFNGLTILNGELFGIVSNSWVRLLPSGQVDPAFTPLPQYNWQTPLRDAQGRFYHYEYGRDFPTYYITRYNPDGTVDATYRPGTVIFRGQYGNTVAPDQALVVGNSLFVAGEVTHLNGTFLGWNQINSGRIELDPAHPRFELDAERPVLNEEDTIATSYLVVRAGPNFDTTARVRYRLSSGTAIEGKDFPMREGALVFEPGVSQLSIHIIGTNDTEAEDVETLQVDFFMEDGTPAGSGEVILESEDMGLKMTMDPQTGQLSLVGVGLGRGGAMLEWSRDLETWLFGGNLEKQTPLPIYGGDSAPLFYRLRR